MVTQSARGLAGAASLAQYGELCGVSEPATWRLPLNGAEARTGNARWWSYGTLAFLAHHEVCLRLLRQAERHGCPTKEGHPSALRPARPRPRRYERVVVTRGDFYWVQDHVPLSVLDPQAVWVPSRFDVGGINDRHAVLNRSVAEIYLKVLSLVESAGFNAAAHATWTSERAMAVVLRGISVRGFPFAAHHVVPSARRPGGASSAWGKGSGGSIKQRVSEAAQQTLSAAPESCRVAKLSAYSSEDVLAAHSDAACLAGSPASASLCGPHAPPQAASLERFRHCTRVSPRYAARFLAEGMDKPGMAGLELTAAAERLLNGPEADKTLAISFLELAANFLWKACKRHWVCERGRGENAFTLHCPLHFCMALVKVFQARGEESDAAEAQAWMEQSRPSWGLLGPNAATRCEGLSSFFHLRTIEFQKVMYCLVP